MMSPIATFSCLTKFLDSPSITIGGPVVVPRYSEDELKIEREREGERKRERESYIII